MQCIHRSLGNAENKKTLELAKRTIDGADDILSFYVHDVLKNLSHHHIHRAFEGLMNEDEAIELKNTSLVGETKAQLSNAIDTTFTGSLTIHGFFSYAVPLLDSFINIIENKRAQNLLFAVFDNTKLLDAQIEFGKTSTHLQAAIAKLTLWQSLHFPEETYRNEIIHRRIHHTRYFYGRVCTLIDTLINQLKDEYKVIDHLKSQIEKSKSCTIGHDVAELRDSVIQSAQKLVANYNERRTQIVVL